MNEWFDSILTTPPIMAILRNYPPRRSVELAQTAWDLGIACVEVPIQTPDAVASLRAVVSAGTERGRPVGAGTVVTGEQVRAALACGAAFTVAPGLDTAVVEASQGSGLPHLPGVSTPTPRAVAGNALTQRLPVARRARWTSGLVQIDAGAIPKRAIRRHGRSHG